MEVMYVRKLNNSYFACRNFCGLIGSLSDLKCLVNEVEYFSPNNNTKVKAIVGETPDFIESLGMVPSMLNLKLSELSSTHYKILSLVQTVMLKPEMLILNNFELGVNDKILNWVSRFLKTVNNDFNIKVVIISQDMMFLSKLAKDVVVMKKGIIKYQGKLLTAVNQRVLAKPEIIKLIDCANKKGAGLDYVLDERELLKSIYRSVN